MVAAQLAVACPKCGSRTFEISGFVGYTQIYDSDLNRYSDYEIDGNSDFATNAICLDCGADVMMSFVKQNVLDFFAVEPDPA